MLEALKLLVLGLIAFGILALLIVYVIVPILSRCIDFDDPDDWSEIR